MAISTGTDAIADEFVRRIFPDGRVEFSLLNEQGSGLGGALNGVSDVWIPLSRVDDLRAFFGDEENAVGFEEKVSFTVGKIDGADFCPFGDAEADWESTVVIHPGVHHPDDGFAGDFGGVLECGEMPQWLGGGIG